MRILIANDDGIYSPGLTKLAQIAAGFGDVRVVAPDVEQSSAGHAISSARPVRYRRTAVIDGIDAYHGTGWSVLVRGKLYHLVDMQRRSWPGPLDPQPWVTDDRDAWLLIEPESITGRRLKTIDTEWAFHIRAYL